MLEKSQSAQGSRFVTLRAVTYNALPICHSYDRRSTLDWPAGAADVARHGLRPNPIIAQYL